MAQADISTEQTPSAVDYWHESRRPLASLVFITPLLVAYEVGVLILGPAAIRNGADVWLRQLLELAGFGQYFLLPVLSVCILLAWHHTTREPWQVAPRVFWGMVCECIVLAFCLRFVLHLQASFFSSAVTGVDPATAAMAAETHETARRLVGFLGAGVYEELLFRLILLTGAAWILRRLEATPVASYVMATVATSLFFSVAHYIGPYAEAIDWQSQWFWFTFLFRFLAGLFFGALFVVRGFGIAAGAHAGYDILVGLS